MTVKLRICLWFSNQQLSTWSSLLCLFRAQWFKQVMKLVWLPVYCSVPNSQLSWSNLPHSPILLSPVTVKHWVVKIPVDEPEQGIDGFGGKDLSTEKCQRPVQDQGMMTVKSWVMILMHQTDLGNMKSRRKFVFMTDTDSNQFTGLFSLYMRLQLAWLCNQHWLPVNKSAAYYNSCQSHW